jgi:hypothetical protein
MDGFVADYISAFWAERGRQPTYDEYAQIMAGYTPDQVPVLSGLAGTQLQGQAALAIVRDLAGDLFPGLRKPNGGAAAG